MEPATPGLQDIGLSPTARPLLSHFPSYSNQDDHQCSHYSSKYAIEFQICTGTTKVTHSHSISIQNIQQKEATFQHEHLTPT